MNKSELVKDFQQWQKEQKYEWSGSADIWIGSYNHYFKQLEELKDIAKKYNELVLINEGMKEQVNNLRHLVDFIEGKGL